MFGMHPELRRRLEKHGVRATAQVVSARQTHVSVTSGNPNLVQNTTIEWKLTVRITPPGAPSFDADVDGNFPQMGGPIEGSTVSVLYDPDDHSKVVVDTSDAGQIDAVAGQMAAIAAKGGRTVDPAALAAALKSQDQAGIRALFGAPAEGSGVVLAGGQAPPAAGGQDPVELLAELQELHQQGVVSDEEFDTQKQRLLGG